MPAGGQLTLNAGLHGIFEYCCQLAHPFAKPLQDIIFPEDLLVNLLTHLRLSALRSLQLRQAYPLQPLHSAGLGCKER